MTDRPNCTYQYNYADKCDCSEDDKCGCTYPNNMPHDFDCNCQEARPKAQSIADFIKKNKIKL